MQTLPEMRTALEEYKMKTGWRGLDALEAIESFLDFCERRVPEIDKQRNVGSLNALNHVAEHLSDMGMMIEKAATLSDPAHISYPHVRAGITTGDVDLSLDAHGLSDADASARQKAYLAVHARVVVSDILDQNKVGKTEMFPGGYLSTNSGQSIARPEQQEKFELALITDEFAFYQNEEDLDVGSSTVMFSLDPQGKNIVELTSNNFFAANELLGEFERIYAAGVEPVFMADFAKENLSYMAADFGWQKQKPALGSVITNAKAAEDAGNEPARVEKAKAHMRE